MSDSDEPLAPAPAVAAALDDESMLLDAQPAPNGKIPAANDTSKSAALPKSRAPKKPQRDTGEIGVSSLPAARVARIIKSDEDVAMCGKEAVFLISKVTEHFVQKLSDAAYANARLDKRKRVHYKDLSQIVRSTDAFSFLQAAKKSSKGKKAVKATPADATDGAEAPLAGQDGDEAALAEHAAPDQPDADPMALDAS